MNPPQLDSRNNVANKGANLKRALHAKRMEPEVELELDREGSHVVEPVEWKLGPILFSFLFHDYFSGFSSDVARRPYWFVACAKVTPFFTLTAQVNSLNLS